MRLLLRIAVLITLTTLALSLVVCRPSPWEMADQSLAALTRELADRAAQHDVQYFEGLTPARERVPELIEQVLRSGIATNYAQHLKVETPTDATLIYGVMGDATPGTAFAVALSLVDGHPRVDQITTNPEWESGGGVWIPSGPVSPPQSPAEIAPVSVTVMLAPGPIRAGSEWSACRSMRLFKSRTARTRLCRSGNYRVFVPGRATRFSRLWIRSTA
jgi:hypothetical protein